MQNEGQKTMLSDEQAIRDLVVTWLRAAKARDTEKLLTLMADDVVFLGPGHPPMKGKAAFAAAQAGPADIDLEATGEVLEIQVLGEWAYLWNKLDIVMTPKKGGTPVKRAGDTLSILHKQNGRWVLFRDANMLAAVEP